MPTIYKNGLNYSGGGSDITVDTALSETSTNPVENQAVTAAINDLQNKKANITDVSNPNLLINPDFRINQRGKTEYTFISDSKTYNVDRWSTSFASTKIILMDKGIKITYSNQSTDKPAMLEQIITNCSDFIGKKLTLTVNVCETNAVNAKMLCQVLCADGSITYPINKKITNGLNTGTTTAVIPENVKKISVRIYGADSRQEDSVDSYSIVDWAKLELGSIATPFVPPDPATELVKCLAIDNDTTKFLRGDGTWQKITSLGKISGDLNVEGNITATGNITGAKVYNAVWNADYAEGFGYEGKVPDVGEIVELCGNNKVKVAANNSNMVVGVCSNTYWALAGCSIEEIENNIKVAVGLVGQVDIKIKDAVNYGDYIVCCGDGIGIVNNNADKGQVIGRAMESNNSAEIKNVKCLIRVQ